MTHPQVGYEIWTRADLPSPVAEIVWQHHEKMNGSGYPQGLSGDDILLEARIICVADVVEAMSSHRPYRPALGKEKAIEEISQNKGRLYDSIAVDACLKLFAENKLSFDDYSI
jgi:HD-GYP domain-containing protein (c-di-GMP phosphodiesterase class II)